MVDDYLQKDLERKQWGSKHFHTNFIKFFQEKIKKTTHRKSPPIWLKV